MFMNFWLSLFGAVAGGMSLVSLVHKHWQFQLAPFAADLLAFYRATFHTLAEPIVLFFKHLLPFTIPHDALVIYTLVGAALLRKAYAVDFKNLPKTQLLWQTGFGFTVVMLWPFALTVLFASMVSKFSKSICALRDWLLQILYGVAAFIVFFLLNAGIS
jgi:hypothetical protein